MAEQHPPFTDTTVSAIAGITLSLLGMWTALFMIPGLDARQKNPKAELISNPVLFYGGQITIMVIGLSLWVWAQVVLYRWVGDRLDEARTDVQNSN